MAEWTLGPLRSGRQAGYVITQALQLLAHPLDTVAEGGVVVQQDFDLAGIAALGGVQPLHEAQCGRGVEPGPLREGHTQPIGFKLILAGEPLRQEHPDDVADQCRRGVPAEEQLCRQSHVELALDHCHMMPGGDMPDLMAHDEGEFGIGFNEPHQPLSGIDEPAGQRDRIHFAAAKDLE
jgi:hypothetical protein